MFARIPLLTRFTHPRTPAHKAASREVEQMHDQLATGITHYLGEPEERARSLARTACEQRQLRRRGLPRTAGPRISARLASESLHVALAHGPCLLALPFSGAALDLLRELNSDASLPLMLVDSHGLASVEGDLGPVVAALPRCSSKDVVKHVKRTAAEGSAMVYVSFPELHSLGAGTTANVAFLGKACRFSLLDPLLCMHGVKTLLTIGRRPEGATSLVSCDIVAVRAAEQRRAIGTILNWLLGHLQASASDAPADTYSWHHLYRASKYSYQIERDNRIKQLDAFFDAWMYSSADLPVKTYQLAKARLAALRHVISDRRQ
jgi:hypothetical protein